MGTALLMQRRPNACNRPLLPCQIAIQVGSSSSALTVDRSEETPVLLPGTKVGPEIIGEILPSGFYPRLRTAELAQALKASFASVSGLRDCSGQV